jgi:ABC-type uncharacterized transport system permease subunit
VGHATANDIYGGILTQCIWLFLLWLTNTTVWRIGVRRLAIQGG